MDFCDISYLGFLLKFVEDLRVRLKSEQTNSDFTCRPTYTYDLSPRLVLRTEKNCVLCDAREEAEETAENRASSIAYVEFRSLKISNVNLPAYDISTI
jgi:hypothetical protein